MFEKNKGGRQIEPHEITQDNAKAFFGQFGNIDKDIKQVTKTELINLLNPFGTLKETQSTYIQELIQQTTTIIENKRTDIAKGKPISYDDIGGKDGEIYQLFSYVQKLSSKISQYMQESIQAPAVYNDVLAKFGGFNNDYYLDEFLSILGNCLPTDIDTQLDQKTYSYMELIEMLGSITEKTTATYRNKTRITGMLIEKIEQATEEELVKYKNAHGIPKKLQTYINDLIEYRTNNKLSEPEAPQVLL